METSRQRLGIVDEAEAHLRAEDLLTPKRQDEINQARFECARIIWLRDRAWACRLIEQIEATGAPFTPSAGAAFPGHMNSAFVSSGSPWQKTWHKVNGAYSRAFVGSISGPDKGR